MDGSVVIGGVGLAVGGIVWMVRLEGRINLGESRFSDLKDDIDEIKQDVKTLLVARPDHK